MSDQKKGDRVQQFKRHAEALNKQFLEWCTAQVGAKPDRLLVAGVADYMRHSAKLRLEFSDIINDDEKTDAKKHYTGVPLLSLMPACHTKTVHFIRHGEGFHNIGLANRDAHLTSKGWQQSHALGKHMLSHEVTRAVELVIVSPLTRALETAAGVFGSLEGGAEDAVLMREQEEAPEVRSAHGRVFVRPGLQYVANELCRERLGPSSCDSRRPRRETSVEFPGVDFAAVESDDDRDWKPGNVESEESVVLRGRQFLQWLVTLPQTNIAVVTHSAFLWFTLSGFGTENARPVRERIQRWYENCEMRTVVLGDGAATVTAGRDTDFRGGHSALEPQQGLMEAEVDVVGDAAVGNGSNGKMESNGGETR